MSWNDRRRKKIRMCLSPSIYSQINWQLKNLKPSLVCMSEPHFCPALMASHPGESLRATLSLRRSWNGNNAWAQLEEQPFGMLVRGGCTVSVSRWRGISKGKLPVNVPEHRSWARCCSQSCWCQLHPSSCSGLSLLLMRSGFLVNVFISRSGKTWKFPVSFFDARNT